MDKLGIIDEPKGWQFFVDATYYKEDDDRHYIWMWNNKHWQHSARTLEELQKSAKVGAVIDAAAERKVDVVMQAIIDNGPLSKKEIMRLTGIVATTCATQLRELCKENRLVKADDLVYCLPNKCQRELFEVTI